MALKIAPFIARMITSNILAGLRRSRAELIRRLRARPHEVHYFHQIDDPYSHLMVQLLEKLRHNYDIKLHMHLVAPPQDAFAPERENLERFSRRDAADIAPHHGLEFTDSGAQPAQASFTLAARAMAAAGDIIAAAPVISEAFWRDDAEALKKKPMVSAKEMRARLTRGTRLRDEWGHYLGGTIYYGGEWYWGVDRLPYLEERLENQRLLRVGCQRVAQFRTRPGFMPKPARGRVTLEFYPSVRSPYSYLAMMETYRLAADYPLTIVTRPVLPMVMRGLPVPPRKGRYILRDTKREANRMGVAFGNISDPVGLPTRRCYSLYPYAQSQGREGAFLTAFCQLAWAEGVDMGKDEGLRRAIERAGLNWDAARAHLDRDEWVDMVEKNRQQLAKSGLWGVPSFRLLNGDGKAVYEVWGRDRIWLLAHKIQEALM